MQTVKDTCDYEEVNDIDHTNEIDSDSDETNSPRWNLMRQVLVCSTIWTLYFIYGLQIGAPTVIIPQLQKEANSSSLIDENLGSWIASMFPLGALPWSLMLPVIGQYFGRKNTFILICLIACIGSIIVFLSKTITHILIGQFISGIILGSMYSIAPFVITEYSSPKYRGFYLTVKSASGFWGIWIANTIGTFWHWKNIYILVFLCNIYTLTVFAWPESPYWLAKEKRFADCAKTYRKLKGTSQDAKKELDHLINAYAIDEDEVEENKTKLSKNYLSTFFKTVSCKSFYKPLLISILLSIQYNFMGKIICSMYAVQLLKKITQNETMAYRGMLILDGVTVFGSYCGCVVSRFIKRRTMLFRSSLLTIIFLYVFSLYLFLIRQSIIIENNVISITILSFYSVTVCSGPMILLTSIYGELISFKHQRVSATIFAVIFNIIMATSLKISFFLFDKLTLPGVFLFFAIISTVITLTLYVYLPETKNKSCHEIENYFKGVPEQNTKNMAILQPET